MLDRVGLVGSSGPVGGLAWVYPPRAQAGKNRCKSSMAQFEYDYFL